MSKAGVADPRVAAHPHPTRRVAPEKPVTGKWAWRDPRPVSKAPAAARALARSHGSPASEGVPHPRGGDFEGGRGGWARRWARSTLLRARLEPRLPDALGGIASVAE